MFDVQPIFIIDYEPNENYKHFITFKHYMYKVFKKVNQNPDLKKMYCNNVQNYVCRKVWTKWELQVYHHIYATYYDLLCLWIKRIGWKVVENYNSCILWTKWELQAYHYFKTYHYILWYTSRASSALKFNQQLINEKFLVWGYAE